MTYLELVQLAIRESGAREEQPSTLVGVTGLALDFKNWVADAWYELQMEHENPPWWFRVLESQTASLLQSQDTLPSLIGMESIDWRTVTCYTTSKTDETPVEFVPYQHWRMEYDTKTYQEGKPKWITETPTGSYKVFPFTDQPYTIRFDGVRSIQTFTADADEPTGLQEQFHRVIAYAAVMRYAMHHEDGAKYADAEKKFRAIYDRLVARQLPPVDIEMGALYGKTFRTGY
jgi:hypothetical protein